jgi:hypothetical protein
MYLNNKTNIEKTMIDLKNTHLDNHIEEHVLTIDQLKNDKQHNIDKANEFNNIFAM